MSDTMRMRLNRVQVYFEDVLRTLISPIWLLDGKVYDSTRKILTMRVEENSLWLDVGCGLKPYASSFDHAHYTGIDIEVSGRSSDLKVPDLYFNGANIPYEDAKFDGILCTQVLEHVEDIDLLLAECNRVLKIGGAFVVSVPFTYREHEEPYDFRRFTSFGLVLILKRNGFHVSQSLKCLSAIETIATMLCVYISNIIGGKNKFLIVFSGLFFIFPLLFLSKYLSKILPDNNDLFCALIADAVKMSNLKGCASDG